MTKHVGWGIAAVLLACACSGTATGGSGPSSQPGASGTSGTASSTGGGAKGGDGPIDSADIAITCNGTLGDVPNGYPSLGEGCRAHFTFLTMSRTNDVATGRGVRKMPAPNNGTWDLGVWHAAGGGASEWSNVWLFVPSLAPGVYHLAERASFAHHASDERVYTPDSVLIEIAGANDEAIWGRFLAIVCTAGTDCFLFDKGRFAAAIDNVESAMELGAPMFTTAQGGVGGELCETITDCNKKRGVCMVNSCESSKCYRTNSDAACKPNERCDFSDSENYECVPK